MKTSVAGGGFAQENGPSLFPRKLGSPPLPAVLSVSSVDTHKGFPKKQDTPGHGTHQAH